MQIGVEFSIVWDAAHDPLRLFEELMQRFETWR